MDQHIYYNGARFLENHGISSFRFNLYGWDEGARNLSDCSIKTHSYDLDLVIKYFRKKGAKKIFTVGHSYGAPTILLSKNKDFEKVILWDPSFGYPMSFDNPRYIKSVNKYLVTWNFDVLISPQMVEEAKDLKEKEEQAIRQLKVPVKIITAGKGHLVEAGKRYFQIANNPKAHIIIKEASHTFDEDGAEEKLLKETLDWIK